MAVVARRELAPLRGAMALARVTVLGAGDMGTAVLTPLHANGHELRLWGTERDAAIVAALAAGQPHPRLGVILPPGAVTFAAADAATALAGADVVIVAITSNAVRPVLSRPRRPARLAARARRRRQRLRRGQERRRNPASAARHCRADRRPGRRHRRAVDRQGGRLRHPHRGHLRQRRSGRARLRARRLPHARLLRRNDR